MTYEQAINYLYSSGMSSEQVKAVENAFVNAAIDRIKTEIVHLHDWAFDREGILRIIDKYKGGQNG
jgi:hypothetical protein